MRNAVRFHRAAVAVAAGALAGGAAMGAVSDGAQGPPRPPAPHEAAGTRVADHTATLVQQALADTSGEIAYQRTAITRDGAPVMATEVWVAPDGTTRFESFSPSGSPVVDETFDRSGQGRVIDYGRHAWWGTPSPMGIAMTDPHQIASDLANGVMHVNGTSIVSGQAVTELAGRPPRMPGSTVDVVISAVDDLPMSSTSHEPGGLVGRTTYRWLPDVPANVAELGTTIPGGFAHLVAPPQGVPGNRG